MADQSPSLPKRSSVFRRVTEKIFHPQARSPTPESTTAAAAAAEKSDKQMSDPAPKSPTTPTSAAGGRKKAAPAAATRAAAGGTRSPPAPATPKVTSPPAARKNSAADKSSQSSPPPRPGSASKATGKAAATAVKAAAAQPARAAPATPAVIVPTEESPELKALFEKYKPENKIEVRGKQVPNPPLGPPASPYQNPRIAVSVLALRANKENASFEDLEVYMYRTWINPSKGLFRFPGGMIAQQPPENEAARLFTLETNMETVGAELIDVSGKPEKFGGDARDHVVHFIYVVKLAPSALALQKVSILNEDPEADDDAHLKEAHLAPVDLRKDPRHAYWFKFTELPGGSEKHEKLLEEALPKKSTASQRRIDEQKFYAHFAKPGIEDSLRLAPVVPHQVDFIKRFRTWWKLQESQERNLSDLYTVVTGDEYKQPRNLGNSSLTTDIIITRQVLDASTPTGRKFQIALIQRGNAPFKDHLALPGGFVNYNEDPVHGAWRELKEETMLDTSSGQADEESHLEEIRDKGHFLTMHGSLERDPRQHTVTCVFVVRADSDKVNKIVGADDAKGAGWYDLETVFQAASGAKKLKEGLKRAFAFDHSSIILEFKQWFESLPQSEKDKWACIDPSPIADSTAQLNDMFAQE
ncbi:hypothetical protein BJ742DRAFT_834594 [Cladochytrium replicatum]|nr:hypothetical protein BJ742DRAFT_834594 [Cladochytrium replicatum]